MTRKTPTGMARKRGQNLGEMEEKFCRAMGAMGLDQSNAVRYAGWVVKEPHNKAWRLRQRPEIEARIDHYRQQAGDAQQVEVAAAGLEPHTREWLLAEHLRNLHTSRTRDDVKEARATLVEIGKLQGLYVEKTEVTTKLDPLQTLSGHELAALRGFITSRMSTVPVVTTVEHDEAGQGA